MSLPIIGTILKDYELGDPTRKLILVAFANHCHDDGTRSFPSLETVAGYACASKRTVQRHLAWLLEHGYMREGDQRHVAHYDSRQRPIVYDLATTPEQRAEWAALVAAGQVGERRSKHITAGSKRGSESASTESRRDILSPQGVVNPTTTSRGDKMSPHNETPSDVTPMTRRRVTGVTQSPSNPQSKSTTSAEPSASAPDEGTPEETSEQQGKRLANAWFVRYEEMTQAPVIKSSRAFMALKQQIMAAISAGYTENQVKAALDLANRPVPSRNEFADALVKAAGGRVPLRRAAGGGAQGGTNLFPVSGQSAADQARLDAAIGND